VTIGESIYKRVATKIKLSLHDTLYRDPKLHHEYICIETYNKVEAKAYITVTAVRISVYKVIWNY